MHPIKVVSSSFDGPPNIIVCGHDRSGKSTAAELLRNLLGYQVVELGDCVRDAMAAERTLPRQTDAAYLELLETIGPIGLVQRCLSELEVGPLAVIGVRDAGLLGALRSVLPGSLLVAIDANFSVRSIRPQRRGEPGALLRADEEHRSWGIEQVIESAEITIRNDGSREEFQQKVSALAKALASSLGTRRKLPN